MNKIKKPLYGSAVDYIYICFQTCPDCSKVILSDSLRVDACQSEENMYNTWLKNKCDT